MTERMLRDLAAGSRLQHAIVAAPGYPGSMAKLARAAKVNARGMAAWWLQGVPPTLPQLVKVAQAVRLEPIDLYRAWFNVAPGGLEAIAGEIRALKVAIQSAGGGAGQIQDAADVVDIAQAGPLSEQVADPSSEPVAPSRRRRLGA